MSLLPRSVEKRPIRVRLRNEIEWHTKCNRLYYGLHNVCSLCLFCHVPLKRDQLDWDCRMRSNDTPNAIGCNNSSMTRLNCMVAMTFRDMTHAWHDSCVTWLMRGMTDLNGYSNGYHEVFVIQVMCDMTHSCVVALTHMWHDSYVTWLICDMTHMWHNSCVTWLLRAGTMTHSRQNISLICDVTDFFFLMWLIGDATHPWLDSFETWLICMCAITHLYVCHDSFVLVPWRVQDRTHL